MPWLDWIARRSPISRGNFAWHIRCHVDQDGAVDGYVYRGATADGMWGQYFAATASPEKPVRPQQRQDYFYPSRTGQPLVKVTRVDRGNGAKFFVQYHWNGQQWIKGLTPEIRAQVPIYRYRDVQNAIEFQLILCQLSWATAFCHSTMRQSADCAPSYCDSGNR